MKSINLFVFLLIIATVAQAQKLIGKITDEKSEPVPFANIVLLTLPDSAFLCGTASDHDGRFELENSAKNRYVLSISCIGYQTVYVGSGNHNIGTIVLHRDMHALGEIVITEKVPRTTFRGNAMVTRIEGTVLEKAGDAYDVLNRIPLVNAKRDKEQIEVLQKENIEIYINGRVCRDKKELERLASDEIKEIEVLTAPGSKYASNITAVIRIKTKNFVGEGLGIDYTNRSSFTPKTDSWRTSNQLGLNYRRKGLDIGVDGDFYNWYDVTNDWMQKQRTQLQNLWSETSRRDSKSKYISFNTSFYTNYQLNDSNFFGIKYEFSRTPKYSFTDNSTSELLKDGNLYEEGTSIADNSEQVSTHRTNLYYNGKIKEWKIAFNADAMFDSDIADTYGKEIFVNDEREIPMQNKTTNRLYAGKLDITYPLLGGHLSFGAEYTYTDRKNTLLVNSKLFSNHMSHVKENCVATWAEYNRAFGKLSATAGVRYEHLASDYYENGQKSDEQSRIYDDCLPTISLSMPIGKVQTMLSYRTVISRPFYSQLSSAVTYDNRYLCSTGDPSLKPQYNHSIMLSSNYKWATIVVEYCDIDNGTLALVEQNSQGNPSLGILRSKQFDYEFLYTNLSIAPTIGIWTLQLDVSFVYRWFKMPNYKNRKFNDPGLYVSIDNTFALPKKIMLNISGYYSPECDCFNTRIGKQHGVYAGLNKSLFNDQLDLTIYADKLFVSDEKDKMFSGCRELYIHSKIDTMLGIRVRYRFNTADSKYKGTGAGSSQRNRM